MTLVTAGFVLIFTGAIVLLVSGSYSYYIEGSYYETFTAFVLILAFTFLFLGFPDAGSPAFAINPGTYKIGFVYQAGESVSLGVEKLKTEKEEGLYLYQFPKKDFEGEIKTSAKKLVATKVTTGEGTFNRYKLE
jgi:hypothetical protein